MYPERVDADVLVVGRGDLGQTGLPVLRALTEAIRIMLADEDHDLLALLTQVRDLNREQAGVEKADPI